MLPRSYLIMQEFKTIQDNAFAFKYQSQTELTILFMDELGMNSSVFSEKSLLDIKRPTNLNFGTTSMSVFTEKVFLPFLLENVKNTIHMWPTQLDCTDCRQLLD